MCFWYAQDKRVNEMKKWCLIFVLLVCAVTGWAAVPNYRIDLDTQYPARRWMFMPFAGATPLTRGYLYQNGNGWTVSVDWAGFLWYGTSNNWRSTNIVRIAGTWYTNQPYVDFQASNNSFATTGTFYGGVVMSNASNQLIEWGLGRIIVRTSGGIGSPGDLATSGSVYATWAERGNTAYNWALATGGDITGHLTNARVVGVRGRPYATNVPTDGQRHTWDAASTSWVPETPTTGGDMTKAVYDTNDNGVVDTSDALETLTASPPWATGTPVYVETDPVWLAERSGYATGTPVYAEADPVWTIASNLYLTTNTAASTYATGTPVYVETDPVYAADKSEIVTNTGSFAQFSGLGGTTNQLYTSHGDGSGAFQDAPASGAAQSPITNNVDYAGYSFGDANEAIVTNHMAIGSSTVSPGARMYIYIDSSGQTNLVLGGNGANAKRLVIIDNGNSERTYFDENGNLVFQAVDLSIKMISSGEYLYLQPYGGSSTKGFYFTPVNVVNGTTGNLPLTQFGGVFSPNSGTANYQLIDMIHTINQGGSSTGDVRGIWYHPTITSLHGDHYVLLAKSGNARLQSGSLSLGTIGTNAPSPYTNGVIFYTRTVDGTNNGFILDTDGNETELGHHEGVKPIENSYNQWTGKGNWIDLVLLAKTVEAMSGETNIHKDITGPKKDWDVEQQRTLDKRAAEIASHPERVSLYELEMAEYIVLPDDEKTELNRPKDPGPAPKPYVKKSKPQWLLDAEMID